MSDLADAVFSGQLLGHLVAGQELNASVIADAANNADLASNLLVDDHITTTEHEIIQAKVAAHVIEDGFYNPSAAINDSLDASHVGHLVDAYMDYHST